jgi:hypothetical protein
MHRHNTNVRFAYFQASAVFYAKLQQSMQGAYDDRRSTLSTRVRGNNLNRFCPMKSRHLAQCANGRLRNAYIR